MSIAPFELPSVPAPHKDFIPHLSKRPNEPVANILSPYRIFERKLREGFAQHPQHDALKDPHINAIPVFNGHEGQLRIRARSLDDETENGKYIMPLSLEDRKPHGAHACVESLKDFRQNFNLFSESSLVDLDWSNVVAAGSSVVTSLLPVPGKYNTSKRALREYYHQKLAPSSDVDLFIWGLDEEAAKEKIKEIETHIRNSILQETTTIRTKNAITIASQYPTRHVQIVLRLYKSVSEILTGFDVDCSCFAYDGRQVYGTPRAIGAFVTQINTIDLTRRSPSYENRLSKYAHRGFEIYWPPLDRQKVDPTIFERSFARTMGLARLLVLENLPKPDDRESYLAQRRAERGRPALNTYYRKRHHLSGNVKDQDPDDVAEWVYEDEIADYHSFTVPYGPKYHAKKIEKLLYTKDLLLNAEWNPKKDRNVSLHRHPCFIGDAESVMHDCCGFCPLPSTDEEKKVGAEESKIYVRGNLQFIKDDPGRQTIGSFNPITTDDWTNMAYVGNTTELCQNICDGNLPFVQAWCEREDSSIDRRDHTGRTPLHLATQCSTPEIVRCIVDHGARIVARLVDGMTALHIAAARGNSDMVQTLLEKSEANENEEADLEDKKRASLRLAKKRDRDSNTRNPREDSEPGSTEEDAEDPEEDGSTTMTDGSFVKVKSEAPLQGETIPEEAQGPDIYDVNVLAWDSPVSPLHLAILGGHVDVIRMLVSKFGADVLLPVKIVNEYTKASKGAIMTLVLAAQLPSTEAANVSKTLLDLGASSAQADMRQITPLHYMIMQTRVEMLKACFENDEPAAKTALAHVSVDGYRWSMNVNYPLKSAIKTGDYQQVTRILELGAKPSIEFDDFLPSYNFHFEQSAKGGYFSVTAEQIQDEFKKNTQQPILHAVEEDLPGTVHQMLELGVDVNTVDSDGHKVILDENRQNSLRGRSLLDVVNDKIHHLQKSLDGDLGILEPIKLEDDSIYLGDYTGGTYQHWQISKDLELAKVIIDCLRKQRDEKMMKYREKPGLKEKRETLDSLREAFEGLRKTLINKGAKPFEELYPDVHTPAEQVSRRSGRKATPFAPKVSFQLPDLTSTKREGYLQLFQAAWEGDADSVKTLTLTSWGPGGDNPPLQIAVQDTKGFSPFSIAVYRQHPELARLILDIGCAQQQAVEDPAPIQRFVINQDNDSDEEDDDGHLAITSELVDEKFTVDNVAALSRSVGSTVMASEMLCWWGQIWMFSEKPVKEAQKEFDMNSVELSVASATRVSWRDAAEVFKICWDQSQHAKGTLARFAIVRHDRGLLHFILQCNQDSSAFNRLSPDKIWPGFHPSDFYLAIDKGSTELVAEMIKMAGAELPLDALVKQSGVEEVEPPKYYQGLSIRGHKKKEWARDGAKGKDRNPTYVAETNPPLLTSAYRGNIAAVEWFLSDAPLRMYKEFGANNSNDLRVKALSRAHGGFDQAVSEFLGRSSKLALHGAILSYKEAKHSLEVIKYLIHALPEAMEAKSISGHTPLSLAFAINRVDAAEALIAAGADQTTRDELGRNIVHLALCGLTGPTKRDADKVRLLLSLIDKRILAGLFLERSTEGPGALTPLARWLWFPLSNLHTCAPGGSEADIFKAFFAYSKGDELVMMDGSGQLPLHQAVKANSSQLVDLILKQNPALLYHENAMGQTPFELAESLYVRHCTRYATNINSNGNILVARRTPIQDREPFLFLPENFNNKQDVAPVIRTWEVCKRAAAEYSDGGGRRKLVSVMEAREIAKRLAEQKKQELQQPRKRFSKRYDDDKGPRDVVEEWYPGSGY